MVLREVKDSGGGYGFGEVKVVVVDMVLEYQRCGGGYGSGEVKVVVGHMVLER